MIYSIISFIFGFIIGYLLFYLFSKFFKFNIIEHGPDSNEIKKQTFQYENNIYYYKPIPIICPTYHTKSNINFFSHIYDIFKIIYTENKNLFNKIIKIIKNNLK